MKLTFEDIAGWEFEIEEVSAGVYRAKGEDQHGHRTTLTGVDPEALLDECKAYAALVIGGSELPT